MSLRSGDNCAAKDYGAARGNADELQASHWICDPEGHVLDGQVLGREEAR